MPESGDGFEPSPVDGEYVNVLDVSCEKMKSERVVSPAAVGGDVLKTVRFDGLLSSAGLTVMRPARPVICEPLPVIAPV